MSDPRPKVRVSGYVPEDLYTLWGETFGDEYGALSWLIETTMREMLVIARSHPTREDMVRQAVRSFTSDLAIQRRARGLETINQKEATHGNDSPANR